MAKQHPRPVTLTKGVPMQYEGPPRLHCWVGSVSGLGYSLSGRILVRPADVDGLLASGDWKRLPRAAKPKIEPKEADIK